MSDPSIHIPTPWSEAAEAITFSSPSSLPAVVLICGPKNSGKSTFARHLADVLLRRYDRVAYLESDVGQPEFTPPGCVSLHVIDEQSSDLSAIAVKTPVRCHFFGDISSKRDPKAYLACILHLYDYFHDHHRTKKPKKSVKSILPLIINTPGWVKGIGYDLLVDMIKHMKPTHVVQIRTTSETKNLPAGAFWLDESREDDVNIVNLSAPCIDSFDKTILIQKHTLSLRDARLATYFQACIPESFKISTRKDLAHALVSIPPYQVSISQIKIRHLHCHVPESEIFHSLNATLVGLAVSHEESTDLENNLAWCVGLGIVRGIDLSKDLLYMITPVPICDLQKVDLLLQGLVRIPSGLLQVRGFMCPYMSSNVINRLDPSGMNG